MPRAQVRPGRAEHSPNFERQNKLVFLDGDHDEQGGKRTNYVRFEQQTIGV